MMKIIRKNDVVTLKITALTSEGNGVGRIDELVVFVPNTAVGDIAEVKIVKVLKTYAFGRLQKLLEPSKDRIENNCPVFEKCGGCAYRHINYDAETREKANQVFHNVSSIGKTDDFEKGNILCNPQSTERYRNKGQYPVGLNADGEIVFGFYAPRSHRIIPVEDCLLQPQIFKEILFEIKAFLTQNNVSVYDENTNKGLIRHVYLRRGSVSGEIMVCFAVNGKTFTGVNALSSRLCEKFPQIKSVVLNINKAKNNVILGEKCITILGSDTINDTMCGLNVKLSPLSFYQVNHDMAERVYKKAGELADFKGNETLLDLYCGAGLIGLSLAKKVKKVVGIEIVAPAVENARENAKNNGIDNAEFYLGDASLVSDLINKGYKFDTAIVDPPRKGLGVDVIDALSVSGAEKIVYVSCNSATLSRDIALLKDKGFKCESVIPADLFPRTIHCETIALLSRQFNLHNMKLHSSPFEMIKSGQKTIELRLFDEKRRQIKTGDKIVFTNTATGETLSATVVKMHRFDSFEELYKKLPLLKCGYTTEDVDKAHPADMERYYSATEQNKYGVVGIELSNVQKL
ncbi:MAG: 23S rRNA (uracil(1939)-C(5))-methyltransferase RlmD [Ruminococcaceae bacterium]|nr:23S rRNA (uracil(1939)-C(5))-methyltransferase RlmD [Oscillospiraceae bacterium]